MSTVEEIEKSLKAAGYNVSREKVQKILDELVRDGFVSKDIETE